MKFDLKILLSKITDKFQSKGKQSQQTQVFQNNLKDKTESIEPTPPEEKSVEKKQEQATVSIGPIKNINRKKFVQYSIFACLIGYLIFDQLVPDPEVLETPVASKTDTSNNQTPKPRINRKKSKTIHEELVEKKIISPETTFENKQQEKAELSQDQDKKNVESEELKNLGEGTAKTNLTDFVPAQQGIKDVINPNISSVIDLSKNIQTEPDAIRDLATDTPTEKIIPEEKNVGQGDAGESEIDILKDMNDSIKNQNQTQTQTQMKLNPNKENDELPKNNPQSPDEISPLQKTTDQELPIPNYQSPGRGLIYNCEQKHWACVNQEEYFICRKSDSMASKLNISSKCVIDSIYLTNDDCQRAQVEEINNKNKKDICKR